MAFPVGVSTCTVTAGRSFSAFGSNATIKVTVTPIFGSAQVLVWDSTGDTMHNAAETFTGSAGEAISVVLPFVDQAGWVDSSGASVTMWYYRMHVLVTPETGGVISYTKSVQPLVGTDTLDLDRQDDDTTVVPVNTVNSSMTVLDGRITGEVSRATTAENSLKNLTDSTFVTRLSNAFVPRWQPSHAYLANDLILAPDGTIVQRDSNGTSRSTYDTTEQTAWTVTASGTGGGGSSVGGLSDVVATATSNGALVAGKGNPVDATSGNRTMTVADATGAGKLIAVSKRDSTANTVTVSFSHLRDTGAGTIVLVGQYEALLLVSKTDGSWWPIGDHKTKAYFDATYLKATKAAVVGTGVHAADLQGTPNLPDVDVTGTGTTLATGSISNVAANGVYFGPDPAITRPTDGSPPIRFGARASLNGSCTVTFTNVVGDLVTSTLLPGEVRTWRQATDLGFGIENAGVPLAQLDTRYGTLLVYNTGVYPARPTLNVPYMYVGPASVAPPDAQEGDLWFFETGI